MYDYYSVLKGILGFVANLLSSTVFGFSIGKRVSLICTSIWMQPCAGQPWTGNRYCSGGYAVQYNGHIVKAIDRP